MTREEEAIESLEAIRNTFLICHGEEDVVDVPIDGVDICAIDRAIEALKARSCGDAVSREHLLHEIGELMQSPWFNYGKDFAGGAFAHYGYVERKEAVEIVRDMCVKTEPPVTPKQRTGKWIKGDATCISHFYTCSECGRRVELFDGDNLIDVFPYCHCGAKMEGESE